MSKYQQIMSVEWKNFAYSLCLIERMFPNYQLFVELSEFGDANIFRNALDVLWGEVAGHSSKVDFEKQLEKLELVTPDTADFDFFGVRPAIDACVALSLLLEACALYDVLSIESIEDIESSTIDAYLEVIGYEGDVKQHSLYLESKAFQKEVKRQLDSSDQRKGAVALLKSFLKRPLVSNIGLEAA